MKHSTPILSLVLVTVALPGALTAQRTVTDSLAHADSIRQTAIELQADPQTFYQAAIAYKDAAGYRDRTDITAVGDLVLAGRLLHASGQSGEALATLEEAAERALSLGDVERAAGAYLDAAWLAQTLDDTDAVQRLGTRAEMLASSPLLDDAQRRNILRRFYRTSNEEAATADLSRADSLHEAALSAQADPSGRESAGRLLVEEASLRPADDRSAVDALILAANLFYAADLPIRAREVLEDAAERASAAGDIVRGARAYLDAATVAQLEGDGSAARSLVEKAEGLAQPPLLPEQERRRIHARIARVAN
jgi:tetratricopeptide (TPR) repeat protein